MYILYIYIVALKINRRSVVRTNLLVLDRENMLSIYLSLILFSSWPML